MEIRFYKRTTYDGLTYMAGEVRAFRESDAERLLYVFVMNCRRPGVWDATAGAEELAAEKGVDLDMVRGSGKAGRILQSDVERVVAGDGGVGPVLFG